MTAAERRRIMWKGIFSGNNGAVVNGNGHVGLNELSANILSGGHGIEILEDKRRRAHQQLAEEKGKSEAALSGVSTAKAQGDVEAAVSQVGILIAQMEQGSEDTASTLCDELGPQVRNHGAVFRAFCKFKGVFRPVAQPEAAVSTVALFAVFFVAETASNTSIMFSGGLFPSIEMAVLFSATVSAVNLLASWVCGFLTLRNWRHTSPTVRGLARRSVIPLAVTWVIMNGGAALLRLSQSVNLREWQFEDMELLDAYSSLALLVIGGLTSAICVLKSYKYVADPDAELDDMHTRCMEQPKADVEHTGDAGLSALGEWKDQANEHINTAWEKVNEVEAAVNVGKGTAEQAGKKLVALAEDLKKQFNVEKAEVSTSNTYSWVESGPTVAGLEFAAHETAILWDQAKEAEIRAFVERSRERLNQARKDVAKAYTEGAVRIRQGRKHISKYMYFSPEVTA